ncbi:general substrate transporter [Flagelloscypha sp. PMI_526]|nr:general substrate transporter [Flagelloscypha sp. PMI_526]
MSDSKTDAEAPRTSIASDDKLALSSIASPISNAPPENITKITEVFNTEFEKATKETALNPLSRRAFRLYFLVMVGYLNAVSSGFDGSLMGGINAMPQYLDFFGYKSTGASTGIVFMIYVVGNCVGSFAAGPATDWKGRRMGMFIGGFFILLGAAVITAAQNPGYFLGGRFILGFGIAISTTAAPTWVTELAPPQWRGRIGACYNACFFIGSIPATGAMVGTEDFSSTWAWRLPLLLQIIPPSIIMTCVWFCPESPRWLISRGRIEEARKILIEYHSNDENTNPMIELQLKECQEVIQQHKMEPVWDYSALWNTRARRWRMLCLSLMTTHEKLVLNFAQSILSAAGAFTAAALSDRLGRRPRLIVGPIILGVILMLVAIFSIKFGPGGDTSNINGANASIVFIFFFGIVYSFTYTPLQALYCAEVMDQKMRSKGMAVHILISNIAGFINTFGNSVGLADLGPNYYWVFVAWNWCAALLWYLFCVETRGRTLEELEEVFEQPWPARYSAKKVKVAIQEDGNIVKVD